MATGLQLTRDHQLTQNHHAAATAATANEIAHRYAISTLTRDQFLVVGPSAELIAHQAAVARTGQYMTAHRTVEAPGLVDVELVVAAYDLAAAVGRAVATADAVDRVRALERSQYETDRLFDQITGTYATWAARAVQMASRDTIVASAEAAGSGWRRVTDGNPCSFCAMLAGRGPVYRSREAASHVVGSRGRKRGTRDIGQRFHDHCGCTIEEVAGIWAPDTQEQKYVDLYDQAVKKCQADGVPATPANITKAMRELGQGVVHDAVEPKTQAENSGGGKEPPRRGAGPFKEMGDPPDPQDKPAWKAYWKERQDAIPLDFKGDTLTADEIPSIERLVRRGELIEWIPRTPAGPTNDFVWTSNGGIVTELKSPKAKYETIRGRIMDAVKNAAQHGVEKQHFLVDIGESRLSDALRTALENYNLDRSKYPISSLWVMHSDGKQLEQIVLR